MMVLLGCALAVLVWVFVMRRNAATRPGTIGPARIEALRGLSELCALQLDEDMLMHDSINGKHIVARVRVVGTVGFDLSQMQAEVSGDTLRLLLPQEAVTVREEASGDAYEVLDAWDARRPLLPRTLTADEENTLKQRWGQAVTQRLQQQGTVARARANAVGTVRRVASAIPSPSGTPLVVEVGGQWE